MTMSATHSVAVSAPGRGWLPAWIGVGVYALFLVGGNRLLIDPDTLWQITVGQGILDQRAVPHTDIYSFTMRGQPWISTQWLAQVLYAVSYDIAGWSGPVVLAALAIAATFALFARQLHRGLGDVATLVFVAAALALMMPHLLARPHVLAMPVMVAWAGGLAAAMDRRDAPSFRLLPLIAVWANLHGGFVLGLALIAPLGVDAIVNADAAKQKSLLLRWGAFGVAAVAASCCTPYGWNALLAARQILELGAALPLILEWRAADFSSLDIFELCLLAAFGLAFYRGLTLPPLRIAMLLGLLHMALSQGRNVEILALLAPLVLARPLADQLGRAAAATTAAPARRGGLLAACAAIGLVAGTFAIASTQRFAPHMRGAPVAAVAALKTLHLARVFNDYDFGGYLIASGVPTFIDGRTELYGERFFVDHNNASGLMEPDNLFRLLADYDIEATLMRTQSAATKLLDHVDGWQKIYADDIATIHLRKPGAVHTAAPAVKADK